MTVVAWVVALIIFFPILWTILTSFKSEGDAIQIGVDAKRHDFSFKKGAAPIEGELVEETV